MTHHRNHCGRRGTNAASKAPVRDPARLFAPARVDIERRPDGSLILRSPEPLGAHARVLGEYLEHWAAAGPDRLFVQERDASGTWSGPTYAAARDLVWRIATGLLRRGLTADTPVVVLSENTVENALLTLAAMHVGIPVVPVSTAYSLVSRDHERLRAIIDQITPGLIYAADLDRYGPALSAIEGRHGGIVVTSATQADPQGQVATAGADATRRPSSRHGSSSHSSSPRPDGSRSARGPALLGPRGRSRHRACRARVRGCQSPCTGQADVHVGFDRGA